MALVAYDSNSDSEYEEEEEPTSQGTVTLTKSKQTSNSLSSNSEVNLFSSLPPPQSVENEVIEEVEDEFLYKKETVIEKPQKRIKIDIPTLNYSSDEEDKPIERKTKQKITGLFSLLPPPKGNTLSNTSFVPNILQKKINKKPANVITPQKRKITPVKKDQSPDRVASSKGSDSTDDEDIDIPETFDDATWLKVCGRKKKQPPKQQQEEPEPVQEVEMAGVEAAPEVDQPYKGLDNKAFKELLGNTKRAPRNIKLIDIHEEDIRPDKEVWLRSLTDPDLEAEPVIEKTVDTTRKVKNHITALAEKALANDKELQRRWSESRYNRKQTQAKYGF